MDRTSELGLLFRDIGFFISKLIVSISMDAKNIILKYISKKKNVGRPYKNAAELTLKNAEKCFSVLTSTFKVGRFQ